jgi:hypothetical protein
MADEIEAAPADTPVKGNGNDKKETKHSWPLVECIDDDNANKFIFITKMNKTALLTNVEEAKRLLLICDNCDTACKPSTFKGHAGRCVQKEEDDEIRKGEFEYYLILIICNIGIF